MFENRSLSNVSQKKDIFNGPPETSRIGCLLGPDAAYLPMATLRAEHLRISESSFVASYMGPHSIYSRLALRTIPRQRSNSLALPMSSFRLRKRLCRHLKRLNRSCGGFPGDGGIGKVAAYRMSRSPVGRSEPYDQARTTQAFEVASPARGELGGQWELLRISSKPARFQSDGNTRAPTRSSFAWKPLAVRDIRPIGTDAHSALQRI